MKIAIIGTAGRGEDGAKMSSELFSKMCVAARSFVAPIPVDQLELVSGGAAWSDHVAVSLFLAGRAASLTLYLPCPLEGGLFQGDRWTAGVANYYHDLFAKKMGRSTLQGLERARDRGASFVVVPGGFKARNLKVGEVDAVLAFTWGSGLEPKDGGTKHTWVSSTAPQKRHVPLGALGDPISHVVTFGIRVRGTERWFSGFSDPGIPVWGSLEESGRYGTQEEAERVRSSTPTVFGTPTEACRSSG